MLMSERPLLIPLFSLIAGISAANQWQFSLPLSLLFFLFATCLLAVFFARRFLFLLCLSLCFFMAGVGAMAPFLSPLFPADSIVRFVGEEPLVIEGIIDARPEWQEAGGRIYLRAVRIFRNKTEEQVRGTDTPLCGRGARCLSNR